MGRLVAGSKRKRWLVVVIKATIVVVIVFVVVVLSVVVVVVVVVEGKGITETMPGREGEVPSPRSSGRDREEVSRDGEETGEKNKDGGRGMEHLIFRVEGLKQKRVFGLENTQTSPNSL